MPGFAPALPVVALEQGDTDSDCVESDALEIQISGAL